MFAATRVYVHARRTFENVIKGWDRNFGGMRRSDYLRDLTLTPRGAKEVRIFGLGDWLVDRFSAAWHDVIGPVWSQRRGLIWGLLRPLMVVAVVAVVILLALVDKALAGELDVGAVVVVAQATFYVIQGGQFGNEQIFGVNAASSLLDVERAEQAVDGLALPLPGDRTVGPTAPASSIELRDVRFVYPGTRPSVLEGLNLTIEAGTSVAIVGDNGAGKTTLVKLLARLYDPTEGRIVVDGVDLTRIDPDQWRRHVSVIFQDFARWELPIADNVGFGRLGSGEHEIRDALRLAQAEDVLEAVRGDLNTVLSRSYDAGVDLSGGQWQKVALARAVLGVGEGGLLILDEPTANLDVRAEAALFDRFHDLTRGATTILLSHRFSTVRRAQRIVVLDGGRVIEDGTHTQLMSLGGRYAAMYTTQATPFADHGSTAASPSAGPDAGAEPASSGIEAGRG